MMCEACAEGRHWDCGMQTWCTCDCDPEWAYMYWPGDDDPGGHSLECTCETCIQDHPERVVWEADDDAPQPGGDVAANRSVDALKPR